MANKEQLAILKQGVKVWNEWRDKNRDMKIDLTDAELDGMNLSNVNLKGADLSGASLRGVFLIDADLSNAILMESPVGFPTPGGFTFLRTQLHNAILVKVDFKDALFTGVILDGTIFINSDLSQTIGLNEVFHGGPSFVDIATIYKSKGNIPEVFLRGVGVPDNFITFMYSLTNKAFEYYSCDKGTKHQDQCHLGFDIGY